jgi:hypothetical protein
VDIEAEIFTIKLRVEALEASMFSDAPLGDFQERRRQTGHPPHLCPCTQALQADITATSIAIAELIADLAAIQTEVSQDLAALVDEIAGLRRHTDEHFAATRSETLRSLDSLHCEMIDLRLRLDQLLGPGDA